MRVPLGWLGEWIDLPAEREVLEERLTLAGVEIEDVIATAPELPGLRVGRVEACEAHPNADRLSLCRVDVGGEEPLAIVCGAPNVAAGQTVAVAPHGTRLPDGTRVKRAKIRGVASQGMICSRRELGLGEEHEGIWVLETDAAPGAPLASALPPPETVLDVEITPNRGDWVSMLGMAREVRALFGGEIRMPETAPPEAGRPAREEVAVRVEDAAGCHRYAARVVRGLRVRPSPGWLRARLEAAGMRPVNAVVDVTNLVLLELGQPLHAFDLDRLRGRTVRVRAAAESEKIATLDGQTRELAPEDLVIADEAGAIAVAGVMGGAETEVGEGTREVLIESAHFAPERVRRTARRLGLHTDASYRFERGVDRAGVERAADRAARLLAELCGGEVAPGAVVAEGEPPPPLPEIRLEPARANRLLGTALAPEAVADILRRLGIACEAETDGTLRCRPPSWRNDLALPADLVEEVARIHGYDAIPTTLPEGALTGVSEPPRRAVTEAVRDAFAGAGFTEVMAFPAAREDDPDALRLPAADPRRRPVAVRNPIQQGEPVLRTSLVPGLLRVAALNRSRQVERVRAFELGRVFLAGASPEALPDEPLRAAAVLAGAGTAGLWDRDDVPLFFRAKGAAERVLDALRARADFAAGSEEPYLHPGASGEYRAGGERVAAVGELHPEVAARFGLDEPVALVAIDVEALARLPRTRPRYRGVSRFPQVRRDVAVLVDRGVAAGDLLARVREEGGESLARAEVFDRYAGRGVPEGKVSLGLRLVFQRSDRTLTDAEVGEATERVVARLAERFGAERR